MNPTSALSFVLCMICTCNASAPREFAYTAHSVCAKKKNIMVFSALAYWAKGYRGAEIREKKFIY